jgi:GT2 family glycosyltransferase
MASEGRQLELCVVVVNYRTPKMVLDCLETLLAQVRELRGRIALVDNASADDSVERFSSWIREHDAEEMVDLIQSPVNDGFAAGNNLGIRSCNAEYYLLLNSDTLVEEGALAGLLARMKSEPRAALVSPRLQWPDGTPQESCFQFHRPLSELIESARSGPITKLFARYEVPLRVADHPSRPEWTSFACVLIRAEALEAVGLLDDGFFMYFEDSELCARVWRAGWEVVHDPSARVVHLRGGSSPVKSRTKAKKRLPRYFYESRARYYYKLYGHAGLLAANACWTLGWGIASLRSVLQPRFTPPSCKAQWRDIWIHFSDPMAPYTHPDTGR